MINEKEAETKDKSISKLNIPLYSQLFYQGLWLFTAS